MKLDELKPKQIDAIAAMADAYIAIPQRKAELAATQADLDAARARYQAEIDAAQLAANAVLNSINASYAAELAAKEKAVEDKRQAMTSATAELK